MIVNVYHSSIDELADIFYVTRKQATQCSGLFSINSGTSMEHLFIATGQRGWK
jgi:hypothetical protein